MATDEEFMYKPELVPPPDVDPTCTAYRLGRRTAIDYLDTVTVTMQGPVFLQAMMLSCGYVCGRERLDAQDSAQFGQGIASVIGELGTWILVPDHLLI